MAVIGEAGCVRHHRHRRIALEQGCARALQPRSRGHRAGRGVHRGAECAGEVHRVYACLVGQRGDRRRLRRTEPRDAAPDPGGAPRCRGKVVPGAQVGEQRQHRVFGLERRGAGQGAERGCHYRRAARTHGAPSPREPALIGEALGETRRQLEVEAPRPIRAESVGVLLVRRMEHDRARPAGLPPPARLLLEPAVDDQAEIRRPMGMGGEPDVPRVAALGEGDLAGGTSPGGGAVVAAAIEQIAAGAGVRFVQAALLWAR
jgi:hypothetical protein